MDFLNEKIIGSLVDKFLTDEKISPALEELLNSYPSSGKGVNVVVIEVKENAEKEKAVYCHICKREWKNKEFVLSKPLATAKFTEIIKKIVKKNG
jgi:hypothetical protein